MLVRRFKDEAPALEKALGPAATKELIEQLEKLNEHVVRRRKNEKTAEKEQKEMEKDAKEEQKQS